MNIAQETQVKRKLYTVWERTECDEYDSPAQQGGFPGLLENRACSSSLARVLRHLPSDRNNRLYCCGVILLYSPGPKGWSALTSGVLRKTAEGAIAHPATRAPCLALDFPPLAALSTNE